MEALYYVIFGLLVIIVIAYIVQKAKSKSSIVKSSYTPAKTNLKADHLYYLPTAHVQVRAIAKVLYIKKADGSNIITNARINEFSLNTTVQVTSDHLFPIALNYTSSVFSNDELNFSVAANGLIQGINVSAEDRLSNTISQLTDAPDGAIPATGKGVSAQAVAAGENPAGIITEIKEYTIDFLITAEEIRNKVAPRNWSIAIEGSSETELTLDASFTLKFKYTGDAAGADKAIAMDGILTRPFRSIIMEVYRSGNSSATADLKYQIDVPDESRVVSIPVIRNSLVKKVHGMKMINGVLMENVINKPSEMEAFVGIPIRIAKAIVSIPAQLLQFKIERINRYTTLETAQQARAKAELQTQKERLSRSAELLKAEMDANVVRISAETLVLKSRLEAEKSLIEAKKSVVTANKEWETAKKELEELLKKVEEAKKP